MTTGSNKKENRGMDARSEVVKKIERLRESVYRGGKFINITAPSQSAGVSFKSLQQSLPGTASLKDAALAHGREVVCGCHQTLNGHNHTYYSVLDGISSPEDMVDMNAKRGYGGVGISDHGTMGGILRAGRAGNKWKTGRRKDGGLMFNYTEVKLDEYIEQYKYHDPKRPLSPGQLREVLSLAGGGAVYYGLQGEPRSFRAASQKELDRDGRRSGKVVEIESLANHLETTGGQLYYEDSQGGAQTIDVEVINFILRNQRAIVTHNPESPGEFKIVESSEYHHVGDFKVLSGCELYCSWENQQHKKYNHITVYATGPQGHRALVLLTSIGSIPSRRFIGARGFFRPRVFVEDIDRAIKESNGELIVTTGCPISITSEALREGNVEGARRFFDWGVEALEKGRFFAELHICDVSLDFNRNYAKAEDKFYSALFDVPISRLRLDEKSEALAHAKTFLKRLKLFTLGNSLRPFLMRGDKQMHHELFHHDEFLDGSDLQKKYANFGKFYPLAEIGIKGDRFELFSKEDIESIAELNRSVFKEADKLLEAVAAQLEGDDEPSASPGAAKRGRGKNALLDEDSALLLSYCLEVLEKSGQAAGGGGDARLRRQSAAILARFTLFVITEVSRSENIALVNPLEVVQTMLAVPSLNQLNDERDDDCLLAISGDRGLCLDYVDDRELDSELLFGAARAVIAFLEHDLAQHPKLAPQGGSEDDREKEWTVHPEGNWMERVNAGLIELAREYDVPLMLATDAHMTSSDLKPVQDAVIKRGKRRAWHMSRPYAIPRSDIVSYLDDVGQDYHKVYSYLEGTKNCAYEMLAKGVISLDDLIEAYGAGSLALNGAKSAGELKWGTVVPKIKYENHPFYLDAKELLESGELRAFLFDDNQTPHKFTNQSLSMATSLIVATFLKARRDGMIPDEPAYYERILSELHLQQEAPGVGGAREELCDFFLVLQYVINKWREAGISVGPGRGSSGGMLTAMICGITFGDPIKEGFLASRWGNAGRKAMGAHADIDIDVDDRQLAGKILAGVARESMEVNIQERPLSPLEDILHTELFFSSAPVTHQEVGGIMHEVTTAKKDLKESFLANIAAAKQPQRNKSKNTADEQEVDADSVATLSREDEGSEDIVVGTPIIRVGTYGSLKAKAAVKEAIRIEDTTPFDDLPSFGDPPPAWRQEHAQKIETWDDERVNRAYEQEKFGYLSLKERAARRRVKLGDRLTKAMSAGSGLARLYKSERDFFHGSVYAICPLYWDPIAGPPRGSAEAEVYFRNNPSVEQLVLNMLNIYKSQGVHAGGMCFGREVFERVPVRADKHGYVAQLEMGDIETAGILKFDVLGLETLTLISETLKLIIEEGDWEKDISWWLGEENKEIYQRVKEGSSPDYLWRCVPTSTYEAAAGMIESRAMTFQIDTPVFGKELDHLNFESVKAMIDREGDDFECGNEGLLGILNAFLALFRPGPMKLDSHKEYIVRMMGKPFSLVHPWIKPFVSNTFGLIIYQEQVMAIYRAAAIQFDEEAGEPLRDRDGTYVLADEGETDEVRRALGKKKISALKKMRAEEKFLRGLRHQGVELETARQIWETIVPFAEYGFNLPHSYHYGLVSAMTLFLKAHFTEHFFRIGMALAKSDDAARFLGEIQEITRPACVLRSDELYWKVIEGKYFPGLLTVEGLKRKDIEKIINARQSLGQRGVSDPTAVEFFVELGLMTPTLAKTLSRSGSLRTFGTPDEISSAYAATIIEHLKPAAARKRAAQKSLAVARESREADDKTRHATGESSAEPAQLDDLLDGLDFDLRVSDPEVGTGSSNLQILETDEKEGLSEAVKKFRNQKKTRKPPIQKAYKLSKKDQEVCDALKDFGLAYSEGGDGEKTNFLTIKSAYDLVVSNKTKGAGVRYLSSAIAYEESLQPGEPEDPLVMIKELRELKTEAAAPMPSGRTYRIVGIPKAISNFANFNTGEPEPRITFLAEGSVVNAKFSKNYEADKIEDTLTRLRDGKMLYPFVATLYVGEFEKNGSVIRYYKIEKIEKINLDSLGG